MATNAESRIIRDYMVEVSGNNEKLYKPIFTARVNTIVGLRVIKVS